MIEMMTNYIAVKRDEAKEKTSGGLILSRKEDQWTGTVRHVGPGPRDGVMTGLVNRFDKPVWLVRTSIEIVVLGMGWLLGGPVGLGTVYYALTIGPVAHMLMPWFALDKRTKHVNADGSLDGDHPVRPGQESFDGD